MVGIVVSPARRDGKNKGGELELFAPWGARCRPNNCSCRIPMEPAAYQPLAVLIVEHNFIRLRHAQLAADEEGARGALAAGNKSAS